MTTLLLLNCGRNIIIYLYILHPNRMYLFLEVLKKNYLISKIKIKTFINKLKQMKSVNQKTN